MGFIRNILRRTDPVWEKYAQEAAKVEHFTPDIQELSTHSAWNIFLYNEFQSGQPKHSELKTPCFYRGIGYTESSDFVLYKKELGKESFPVALEISEDQKLGPHTSLIGDPGQIMGEIYSARFTTIVELDKYMLNTVRFERKRVSVLIPFKADPVASTFDVTRIEAWMYVGRSEHWLDQLKMAEAHRLISKSNRLFCAKDSGEPLGAYYTFDYNVEAITSG